MFKENYLCPSLNPNVIKHYLNTIRVLKYPIQENLCYYTWDQDWEVTEECPSLLLDKKKMLRWGLWEFFSHSVQNPQRGKMPVTLWRWSLNICRDAATLLNQFYSNQQRPQKSAKPWGFAFRLTTALRKCLQANMTTWISQFFFHFSYTSKGILLIKNALNYAW